MSSSIDGDTSTQTPQSSGDATPRASQEDPLDPLRLLTTDEVARLLQVHPLTVRRAVANKKLRCIRLGRSTRFKREDVAKYVQQMSTTGARSQSKGTASSESARQSHAPKRSSKK